MLSLLAGLFAGLGGWGEVPVVSADELASSGPAPVFQAPLSSYLPAARSLSGRAGLTFPAIALLEGTPVLTLTKSAENEAGDPLRPGEILTYTLVISNGGDGPATGVTISDTFPAFTAFVGGSLSITPAEAGGSGGTQPVLAYGITIAAGSEVTTTYAVEVDAVLAHGTEIANTAEVTSTEVGTPVSATSLLAVTQEADLALTKSSSPVPALPGRPLTYTLVITNNGPGTVTAITLTDEVPADLLNPDYEPATGSFNSASGAWTGLNLGEDETISLTIAGTLDPAFTGTLENTAVITPVGAIDPVLGNNSAENSNTAAPEADLVVSGTYTPAAVIAGTTVTYTLTVTNNGPSDATTITLTDDLPTGFTFASATPAVCSGTTLVTCNLGSLAAGSPTTLVLVASVASSVPAGSPANEVNVSSAVTDPSPGNNDVTIDTTVQTRADLVVSGTYTPAAVIAGTTVTYTLTVTNNGPSDATTVTLTDDLPTGFTFASATPAVCSGTTLVTCNLGSLTAGSHATVVLVASVASSVQPGSLANEVNVSSPVTDPSPGNNDITILTTAQTNAVLMIGKSDDPDPVVAGTTITYTLTVTNNGPSDAAIVSLSDALPAIAVDTITPDQGSCTPGSGFFSCSLQTIPAGLSARIVVVGIVPSSATSNLANTATVWSPTDPNTPKVTTQNTTVIRQADLTISKLDNPNPVTAGESLTYTLTITNNGPSDASSVSLTDPLPTGLTPGTPVASQGGTCGKSGNTVTCNVGTLTAGQKTTITIPATVAASLLTNPVNTATVASTTSDPNSTNNSATVTTTLQTRANLALTKSSSPATVFAGEALTYTLTITNYGPSAAQSVVVTDTLPAGLTAGLPTAGQGTCGKSGNTVTCTLGALALNQRVTITIPATIASSVQGNVVNTATAGSSTTDPTAANNTITLTTTVQTRADLVITKFDAPDPALVTNPITHTIIITNNGPSDAQNVVVTDTLPAGMGQVSAGASQGSCTGGSPVVCNLGPVTRNATATVTLIVTSSLTGLQINQATVSSSTSDPGPGSNTASATTTVNPKADLSLLKSVAIIPSSPITAGVSTLIYTLFVSNNGPSPAASVVVTDSLPAGLTLTATPIPSQGSCGVAGSTITCSLGIVSLGTFVANIPIQVTVNSSAQGTLNNTATISSPTADENTANNTASISNPVTTWADLVITKHASAGQVLVGDPLTYTLTITNTGPSNAQGVTITDTLPAGLTPGTPVASKGSCNITGSQIVCSPGVLALNATVVITIPVTPIPASVGSKNNTATVSSTTLDKDLSDNTASVTTVVAPKSDLQISQSASSNPIIAGESLTYTQTITNTGPSPATGVVVTDTLPAGLTVLGITPPAGCSQNGNIIICNLGTINNGDKRTITIKTTVLTTTLGPLMNVATVKGNEADPISDNNTVMQITTSSPGGYFVYLPLVLTPEPATLSVKNTNAGALITFEVLGAGVSCQVPLNQTVSCGSSFPSGTYTVRVSNACGQPPVTASKTYNSGPNLTEVSCN